MVNKPEQCNCGDWKENLDNLNALMSIARGFLYDGKPFAFCPWCGKKLLPTIEEMSGLIKDFHPGQTLKEYMEELSDE